MTIQQSERCLKFQSTLPVRGATSAASPVRHPSPHFNPRSPCGERLAAFTPTKGIDYFNPRSPCGERPGFSRRRNPAIRFQSTLPVRGATGRWQYQSNKGLISIHAPRAGSDYPISLLLQPLAYFNPRSPCGERRLIVAGVFHASEFQSTLPVRGATQLPRSMLV